MAVSETLSQAVRLRADGRCQYCLMHESLQGATFHVEHIIPQSKGGHSVLEDLALACPGCNLHKADRTTAVDPATGEQVPLFHPIRQRVVGALPIQKAMKWKDGLPLAAQPWRCSI